MNLPSICNVTINSRISNAMREGPQISKSVLNSIIVFINNSSPKCVMLPLHLE